MIWYGGDYNPEQWPEEVWDEDARLMQQAGVTMVSVGIFSWAMLEPREGEFDFGWLDRVMDGAARGRRARRPRDGDRLAAAVAHAPLPRGAARHEGWRAPVGRQPPAVLPEFARVPPARGAARVEDRRALRRPSRARDVAHQQRVRLPRQPLLLRDERPTRSARGSRLAMPRSTHSTRRGARRSGRNAIRSSPRCSRRERCRHSATRRSYSTSTGSALDQLLELYRAEAAIVRAATPSIPVTTNFMGFFKGADYWAWAQEVDVVSDDSYPDPADPLSPAYAAMTRDLMRSLRHGQPWILMEQAPSAVNWRARNAPKAPGQMAAWSKQAVARGADGILFFQWRQSVAGAEKFHSAMLPHAGTDTRVWREITELGADLAGPRGHSRAAASMRGSRSCSSGTAGEASSRGRCPRL